jgi:hypothetical protein
MQKEVSPRDAIAFVERHGVVLQAARGPVPSLAEAIACEPIRGSWWGHAKGGQIFRAARAVCESPDVLVCKLIDNKVTYVHRQVWPALVKLAPRFGNERLAKVWDEHTKTGVHVSRRIPFPNWVPSEVMSGGDALDARSRANPIGRVSGEKEQDRKGAFSEDRTTTSTN